MVLSGSLVVVLLIVLWFARKKFSLWSVLFGAILGAVLVTSTPWGPQVPGLVQSGVQKGLSAGADALGVQQP
jgi:hypothetical protein